MTVFLGLLISIFMNRFIFDVIFLQQLKKLKIKNTNIALAFILKVNFFIAFSSVFSYTLKVFFINYR